MICLDNQPFQILENTGFKELINFLEPQYILPFRKTLLNGLIPRIYEKHVVEIRHG